MEINAEKLKRMQTLHVAFILLDVRTKSEYEEKHISGALHLDAKEFLEKIPTMIPDRTTPIVIYSQDGKTARDLVLAAEKSGFVNMVNLENGFSAFI